VELWTVACDDLQEDVFRLSVRAVRDACQIPAGCILDTIECSLGSRARHCTPQLVAGLRQADGGRNVDRHHFDMCIVASGPHAGKQVVGVGKSKRHRSHAANIAFLCRALFEEAVDSLRDASWHLRQWGPQVCRCPQNLSYLGVDFVVSLIDASMPAAFPESDTRLEEALTGVWAERASVVEESVGSNLLAIQYDYAPPPPPRHQ
jgi:hypothetical protein